MRASVILALAVAAILAISHASAEDAYVQSSGSQAIDTGYHVNSNTRLVVDFEIVKTNASSAVFGATGGSGTTCMLWCNSNRNLEPNFGGWLGGFGAAKENGRRTVVFDMPEKSVKLYNHGSETPWGTKTGVDNGEAGKSLILFADNSSSGLARFSTCKIYSFKVYEKNGGDYDLIHEWLPAAKGSEIGFVDSVDGSFIHDRRLAAMPTIGGDYITLEDSDPYIESDGRSVVNTGVFTDTDIRIEVDYALTAIEREMRVVGVSKVNSLELYVNNITPTGMSFVVSTNYSGTVVGDADLRRHKFIADVAEDKVYIVTDNVTNGVYTTASKGHPIVAKGPVPISLFGRISDANGITDWSGGRAKARIYGSKFYKGGVLVKNLVPFVKGGVAGFRDTVGGTFHTGEFNVDGLSAGGNVERAADDGYVELTGNNHSGTATADTRGGHYINTGYIPGVNTRVELDYAFAANNDTAGRGFSLCAGIASGNSQDAEVFANSYGDSSVTFKLGASGWVNMGIPAQTNACHVRRTVVFDAFNSAVTMTTAGYVNYANTNGTKWVTQNMSTELYLGAGAYGTSGWGFAPVRIYGLKIYESDTLVREYVPYVENGAPGLKYGDTFVNVSWSKDYGKNGMPRAGGNITVSSDRDHDAYVLFSGAQSIDTGYHADGNSKFVVDFSFVNGFNNPQQFVFNVGEQVDNQIAGRIYTNLSGGNNARYAWSYSKAGNWTSTDIYVDHQRRLFTIDAAKNQVRMTPGDYNGDSVMADLDNGYTCSRTTKIGSNVAGDGFYAKMRLYRFTIYDGNDKVHEFVPCVTNGVAGLYDIVGNEMFTSPGLEVGGRGYDSAEEWIVPPADCKLKHGETKTLKVLAIGAIRYKWTKNGEAVSGGEDGELTAEWVRGGGTDVYTVTPVYDVFGVETDGATASFNVENVPMLLLLIFR